MKQLTINLTENSHPHAEMIAAKAADMSLVVFCKGVDEWYECDVDSFEDIGWYKDFEYFLCLPKHKNACLHWLNGGEVQGRRCSLSWPDIYGNPVQVTTHWVDIYGVEEWDKSNLFMSDYYEFRIKPKKEKRWIAFNKHTGDVYGAYLTKEYCDKAWSSLQIFEIEVEVTQ